MSSLIDKILEASADRIAERRRNCSEDELKRKIQDAPPVRSLRKALSANEFSVIAEHKRCSPSAGMMKRRNLERAFEVYSEKDWISAISVLTDIDHFKGELRDLQFAREKCGDRPILRKDFIVEEYQVYEARAYGADAILLMATLHTDDPARLQGLFDLARDLGMDALVELGMGEQEPERLVDIVPPNAEIWGVNSRNFHDVRKVVSRMSFKVSGRDTTTNLERHRILRSLIRPGKLAVAESGIKTAADLSGTREAGYNAALIGTAFLAGAPVEKVAEEFGEVFKRAATEDSVLVPQHAGA